MTCSVAPVLLPDGLAMTTRDDERPAAELAAAASFRGQLTVGEDQVDPATWAGSLPVAHGIAPRVRVGRDRWLNLLWLLPIGFVLLLASVAAAKGLRAAPGVQRFITEHPGAITTPRARAHAGLPLWVGVQRLFNLLLLMFILRSGLQIFADHPRLYWTRHSTPGRDWFRAQKPVPSDPLWTAKQDSISLPGSIGLPGLRHSIGLARWWHLGTDTLWLANGLVLHLLLFSTEQWRRVVPSSWEVFPSAASVLLQYASLDGPVENGFAAYNSLQLLAYFVTVFVAAPLALLTGLGMSPALSTRFRRTSKVLSIQTARSLHSLVLVWFVLFIVLHVTFAATTGLLRNLSHTYTGTDSRSWLGFGLFALSMALLVVGWVAATPLTLRHPRTVQRVGAVLIGPTERLFEHLSLQAGGFADYRLRVNGLVEHPVELSMAQLRALPVQEQVAQHFCIQGWSGIAKWRGVSLASVMDLVHPFPAARWVVFYSLGDGPDGGVYYDAHPVEQMSHHLTMLAYDMNDLPLSFGHGAPLRLRLRLREPAGLQAGQVAQGHRVHRPPQRGRRRPRRR